MPTFEEQLNKHIEEHPVGERIDLADLPEELSAKITKFEYKKDKQNNECLFLSFVTPENKLFTQKYTHTSWKFLNDAIAEAGGYEKLSTGFTLWKRQTVGRMTKGRMFPVAETTKRKK